jgi:hypothetical protein
MNVYYEKFRKYSFSQKNVQNQKGDFLINSTTTLNTLFYKPAKLRPIEKEHGLLFPNRLAFLAFYKKRLASFIQMATLQP